MNTSTLLIKSTKNKNFGTAFCIKKDEVGSYFVTCTHVIEDCGKDSLELNEQRASIVALGSKEDIDLAVVFVKGFFECAVLKLSDEEVEDGRNFRLDGFQRIVHKKESYKLAELNGFVKKSFEIHNDSKTINAYELNIGNNDSIERGYSGSAIVCDGLVVAMATDRNINGKEAYAVPVRYLREIWTKMDEGLFVSAQTRKKIEEKLIFDMLPRRKQVYIDREVDAILSNRIAQKVGGVLFLYGQGGVGKTTLLEKFSQTNRPTLYLHINQKIEMNMVDIFLDENKTTSLNCPNFEVKLDEVFEQKENDEKIPFNTELKLLEALEKDFGEHGVFIVDTFEKNKNSHIDSHVKFTNNRITSTRTKIGIRFKDYLENLVYLFTKKSTFIIAGRNRIDDVTENRSEETFLNIDEVQELEMQNFSATEITEYIEKSHLDSPSQEQLTHIVTLTGGNPLLIFLFVRVAKDYSGWDELNYEEMKKNCL